jgi:hypothetical protein
MRATDSVVKRGKNKLMYVFTILSLFVGVFSALQDYYVNGIDPLRRWILWYDDVEVTHKSYNSLLFDKGLSLRRKIRTVPSHLPTESLYCTLLLFYYFIWFIYLLYFTLKFVCCRCKNIFAELIALLARKGQLMTLPHCIFIPAQINNLTCWL